MRTPPRIRPATASDNAALVNLAAACPMRAPISICVRRAPDFFALNRLEGDDWEVAVLERPGAGVVGCVAMAVRRAWIDGEAVESAYVSDLKVRPDHRATGAADALTKHAWAWAGRRRPDLPTLITVLGGNRPMERRIVARRSLPPFTRIGTLRVHTLPLLRPPRTRPDGLRVDRAGPEDLGPMAELWADVGARRQFAPWFDADGMRAWIDRAVGLELEDYRVARDSSGRIAGFLALWDQEPLKQLGVVSLSRRAALFRHAINTVAPLLGAARVPGPGASLPCVAALHVCVPPDRPDVLRQLLAAGAAEAHGRYAVLTIGLDARDPLRAALRGVRTLPADVVAYAASPDGRYRGPIRTAWPLHFETALV